MYNKGAEQVVAITHPATSKWTDTRQQGNNISTKCIL